jgi:hypothetical protein
LAALGHGLLGALAVFLALGAVAETSFPGALTGAVAPWTVAAWLLLGAGLSGLTELGRPPRAVSAAVAAVAAVALLVAAAAATRELPVVRLPLVAVTGLAVLAALIGRRDAPAEAAGKKTRRDSRRQSD